ncbi:MAG: protein kinase [Myxococcota bacterium]
MLGGAQTDPVLGMPGGHSQLGKYQLLRRIATGGMAELFLARATAIHGFEKLVVLKRILPQHAESEDFIRMFLAEARLAATLHHPNIVQVYDIGEEGTTYFFTMEYVQGQDLRRLVRAARKAQKALPLEHILHIVMGVAAGLNHAHEKIGLDGRPLGIVHRDVSPSNVLVTYEGGVKIVDFGIAKAATAQTATIAGTLKGKIPYMSPEQCRGEAVDRRSDIFSIGTLLWELTTGSRLFTGENEFSIINRVAAGDVPPPSSVREDYPPELEAIVMRALQADRELRYPSAQDLQIDLEDFAREARLPVSSARMAKFMRGLFSEEIRQATLQLQSDRLDEQPTMRRPALSRDMLESASSMTGAAPSRDSESVEVTPSEIRADQVMATPGPAGGGYATDVTYEERKRGSAGVVLAVITTLLAVFGAAALVWFFVLDAADARKDGDAKQDRTPAVIVESPAPSSSSKPASKPEPESEAPKADPPRAKAEPADEPAPDAAGPDDPKEFPESDAEAPTDEPSADPKDDKTEAADSSPKRGHPKRGNSKRKDPKGSSEPKPKWDPNSPLPQ